MAVLLPILEYGPAATYLIPTPDVQDVAEAVRKVAQQQGHRVTVLEPVDPYAAEATRRRCAELIAQLPPGGTVLNLSGGTTIMALGAQQAARQHNLPMLYVNTDDGELIHLAFDGSEQGRAPLATRVSLAQYALAHDATCSPQALWGASWDGDQAWARGLALQEPYQSLARMLGAAGDGSVRLLDTIRRYAAAGMIPLTESLSETERQLIDALLGTELLAPDPSGPGCYRIGTVPHTREFLEGHWLEFYVADVCAASGYFDDVRCGVKLIRNEGGRYIDNDLDVVVTSRGRMAAISCKTGLEITKGGKDKKEERKLAIYELNALLQADLMGLYARKVLVTNQLKLNEDLRRRAFYGQICCINGARLVEVAEIVRDHLDRPQLEI
ncbi:MAG: Card1-like endonuclease domain-containing protein [Oscillochloridaceae bacterium umkhey_bin13]